MSELMSQLQRATKQVKENELGDAIETLKAILEEDAEHEVATGMLAAVYLQIGRIEAAITLYNKLLDISPDNPLARFQLGLARLNNGEPSQALETWQPMLEMKDEFMAHFHSALAQIELRHPEEAMQLLNKAGESMPIGHPLYPQLIDLQNKLSDLPGEQ